MKAPLMMTRSFLALLLVASAGCGEADPDEPTRCASNAECTLPQLCSEQGLCEFPPPAAAGEACSHDEHCQSKACLDLGAGPICLTPCDDPGACAADQDCTFAVTRGPAAPATAELQFICQKDVSGTLYLGEACQADIDCGSGLCHQDRCSQPCGACPGRLVCDESELAREGLTLVHGLCSRPPLLETIEIGSVDTPIVGAQPLSFEVPEGLRSFVIVAEDQDHLWVSILKLEGPDGAQLINTETLENSPMRASHYYGVSTALIPGTDNPDLAVVPGTYKLYLGTFDPKKKATEDILEAVDGDIERVSLVLRRAHTGSGLLDLNIHFSPGTGLTADTAAEDEYFVNTLARLEMIYRSRFGVALGEIETFDLPETEDEVVDGDDARNICRHYSKPGPNSASINLFFVKSLDFAGGFSGGIPGAPGLFGHAGSGIVMRKYNDYTTMGALIAHEMGHFLGLFHTTEFTGLPDPIEDTVVCPAETPVEQCPDEDYLMFPAFKANGALTVSAGQADVLRSNPGLYEIIYPDVCGQGVEGVDITRHGYASGVTVGAGQQEGSCGGKGQPERVHLLRLEEQIETMKISVKGHGFSPAVYVRREQCTEVAREVSCETIAADEIGTMTLDSPAPGTYFIIVDGVDGGGRYDLSLTLVRAAQ